MSGAAECGVYAYISMVSMVSGTAKKKKCSASIKIRKTSLRVD